MCRELEGYPTAWCYNVFREPDSNYLNVQQTSNQALIATALTSSSAKT